MTVRKLREKYLRFFESKGHTIYPSGSLVPYDVTGRLDESLLFNGAGMIQFKPYFRGVAEPANKRLTTAQKCVRTGDIEEVGDLSHLTFFEMMGNFSFGDYFKKEAIAYSWEFLTSPEWLALDPTKLAFTVFESDDEAYNEWSKWLSAAGIDPSTRIFRLGEDTNYWPASSFTNGPPGPCGPNSEMFYWTGDGEPPVGPYGREDFLRDDDAKNWLEIWNDVFIQYEWQGTLRNPARPSDGYVKEGMPDLPFQSIDTGMGLDRTAAVLMGKKSVYDTDAFEPILRRIQSLRGSPEEEAPHRRDADGNHGPEAHATRIVADHIRTACFCIADGVLPGNTGRGYVLRRLIRRAVLKGQRVLGFEEPFFHLVYEGVVEAMGDHYTELVDRRDVIVETLKNEEAQFRRTLAKGVANLDWELLQILTRASKHFAALIREDQSFDLPLGVELRELCEAEATVNGEFLDEDFFQDWVNSLEPPKVTKVLREMSDTLALFPASSRRSIDLTFGGKDAFDFYDTFGFPLEITQELATEAGVTVDVEGYEKALAEAQERSRGGTERESVYGGVSLTIVAQLFMDLPEEDEPATKTTVFTGYEALDGEAKVVGVLPEPDETGEKARGTLVLALDRTPFYAESGGQTSDHGTLSGEGFVGKVTDVMKQDGVFIHVVEPTADLAAQIAGKAMHEAKEILAKRLIGTEVRAAVDTKRRAMIRRNHTATHLLQAALRRVLGNHVTQAGSYVGPDRLRFDFTHGKGLSEAERAQVERIVNEEVLKNTPVFTYVDLPIAEARAKGAMALFGEKYGDKVRMVEVGDTSRELCGGTHVRSTGEIGLFKIASESSAASGVRRIEALTGEGAYEFVVEETSRLSEIANLLRAPSTGVVEAVQRTLEQLREEKRKREKAEMAAVSGKGGDSDAPVEIKGVKLFAKAFGDVDSKIAASALDNAVAADPNLVALAAVVSGGKVQFSCKVGPEAVAKGAHAGNLIREVAKIAGGGGGGRPDFATAGGKDASKVSEALTAAAGILEKML